MANNFKAENTRMRAEHPEQFTQVRGSNSLSQVMVANELIRRNRELKRFDELEELILETSALDPKFQEYVNEYNNLKIRIVHGKN